MGSCRRYPLPCVMGSWKAKMLLGSDESNWRTKLNCGFSFFCSLYLPLPVLQREVKARLDELGFQTAKNSGRAQHRELEHLILCFVALSSP